MRPPPGARWRLARLVIVRELPADRRQSQPHPPNRGGPRSGQTAAGRVQGSCRWRRDSCRATPRILHERLSPRAPAGRKALQLGERKLRNGQRRGKGDRRRCRPRNFTAGSIAMDGLLTIRPDGKLYVHQGVGNLGTGSVMDTARVPEFLRYAGKDKRGRGAIRRGTCPGAPAGRKPDDSCSHARKLRMTLRCANRS